MGNIKNYIKYVLKNTTYGKCVLYLKRVHYKYIHQGQSLKKFLFCNIKKTRIYQAETPAGSVAKLLDEIELEITEKAVFFYIIKDFSSWDYDGILPDNTTIDYECFLRRSLASFYLQDDDNFSREQNCIVNALIRYSGRICVFLKQADNQNKNKLIECFQEMPKAPAGSFFAALQRILFLNQILWQTGHTLNGLGCLDQILWPYYQKDIEHGKLTQEQAREMLKEFCKVLHKDYGFKSNVLLGDTGQIIFLGGSASDGSYVCNKLTYLFIQIVEELQLPDPKIMLRVNRRIPKDLLSIALECISTGIGSPLLANDEVIIPQLLHYGYEQEDVYRYGVAACWEPLIPGKSLDHNNIDTINFCLPLQTVLTCVEEYRDFRELLDKYCAELRTYVQEIIKKVNEFEFVRDPLVTVFTSVCKQRKLDVSEGGARYNNFGILSVGLGNAIDALFNIRKYVFDEKRYSLRALEAFAKQNYEGHEEVRELLSHGALKYGMDHEDVLLLVNDLLTTVNQCFKGKRNYLGGKFKFGLSAPGYVDIGMNFPATLDGRKANMPFSTHISCAEGIAYTELMSFASQIDYSGYRFNGNVVDFLVSPEFIKNNFGKFLIFLQKSIELGFFEMQMNVVSSAMLIAAKQDPDKFPTLIVRVWGFSAYFKDLPEAYKDVLIARAIKAEKVA